MLSLSNIVSLSLKNISHRTIYSYNYNYFCLILNPNPPTLSNTNTNIPASEWTGVVNDAICYCVKIMSVTATVIRITIIN